MIDSKRIDKEYYTTEELASQPWFPLRSADSVRRLIKVGKIKAVNVSTVDSQPKWQIPKQCVIDYIKSLI